MRAVAAPAHADRTARAGAGAAASARPAARFRLRPAAAGAPLRVALVGDSVAYSLLPSIGSALTWLADDVGRPTEFVRGFLAPGFGLTADTTGFNVVGPAPPARVFATWPSSLELVVDQRDPDLFVVLVGAWDTIGRLVDGRWLAPGSREWDTWYRGRVDVTMRLLTERGASVVWLLMPCTNRAHLNARLPWVNLVIGRTPVEHPQSAAVLDLGEPSCPGGRIRYVGKATGGTPYEIRMRDGVHFSPFGAPRLLADWLRVRLRDLVAPPAPPPDPPRNVA